MSNNKLDDVYLWRHHATAARGATGARADEYEVYVPYQRHRRTIRYGVYGFRQYQAGMGIHLGRLRDGVPVRNTWQTSLNRQGNWVEYPVVQSSPPEDVDFTPRADLVVCAPYAAISTAASNIQNGRDYLNDANAYRIRQDGSIARIRVRIGGVTATIIFKVWRLNGSGSFNLVGASQDFASAVAANTTATIDLTTPIAVQEGDFTGIFVSGGSQALTANTGQTGATLRYFSGPAPNPADFRGAGFAAAAIAVPIECHMQAPSIVHIGDSRAAGHPMHFAFTETTLTTDIAATVAKQLQNQIGFAYQNMGIGSQTSTAMAARFDADVVALKPRAVVIDVGVNDVSLGIPQATFIANYTNMLNACDANGIRPLVMLIHPWHGSTNLQAQTIDEFNAALLSLAAGFPSAIVVDARGALGEERTTGSPTPPPGNLWNGKAEYRADSVHWNSSGNGVLAQTIADTLAGLATAYADPLEDFPTPTGTTLRSKTPGDTLSGTVRGHTVLLRASCPANGGFALVSIDGDEGAANRAPEVRGEDFHAVTNVVNNGAGACRVSVPGHLLADGAVIRIEGVKGVPGAEGTFVVQIVDENRVDLLGSTFGGLYISGGSVSYFSSKDLGKRYVDLHSSINGQFDEHIPLAEELADVDHEVTLTVVGTARGGGSDGGWVHVHGIAASSADCRLGDHNSTMGYCHSIFEPRHRDEFSSFVSRVVFAPVAAPTHLQAIGEADGHEQAVSWTWRLDGQTVVLAPGELVAGQVIALDEVVDLEHPAAPEEVVARRRYRFAARAGQLAGVVCDLQTRWRTNGTCHRIDVGRLPLGVRNRASGSIENRLVDLASWSFTFEDASFQHRVDHVDADDGSLLGKVQADTVTWSSEDHSLRVFVTVPRTGDALAGFQRSEPLFVHVVDRPDGQDDTVFTRTSEVYPEPVTPQTVHRARVGWNIGRARIMARTYVVEAARVVSPLDRPGRHLLENTVEVEGVIPVRSWPTMLARVVDAARGGDPCDPLEIWRASYDVYLLDDRRPEDAFPVDGHFQVHLDASEVMLSGLRADYLWGGTDSRGYNVLFRPYTLAQAAFPEPHRFYRVVLRLIPWTGPDIPLRFRLRTV